MVSNYIYEGEIIMTEVLIFEPALCCSTGVCGPSVNEDLLQITSIVNGLDALSDYQAKRYNLSNDPQEFVNNEIIVELLKEQGADVLPATILNGELVKFGEYPSIEEIEGYTGLKIVPANTSSDSESCCGPNSGCC